MEATRSLLCRSLEEQRKDTPVTRYILSAEAACTSGEQEEVNEGILSIVAGLRGFFEQNPLLYAAMGDPGGIDSVALGLISQMLSSCRSRFDVAGEVTCPETVHLFSMLNLILHHAGGVDPEVSATVARPRVFAPVLMRIAWASVFLFNLPGGIQLRFSENICGALKYGSMHHSFRSRKRAFSKAVQTTSGGRGQSEEPSITDAEAGVLIMMCLLTHPSDLRKNANWESLAEKPWMSHLRLHQAEYFGSFCSMVIPSAFANEHVSEDFLHCEYELSHELRLALIRGLVPGGCSSTEMGVTDPPPAPVVSLALLYVGACMVMINSLSTQEYSCTVIETETFVHRLTKAIQLLNMAYMDDEVRARAASPVDLLYEASAVPEIEQAFYFAALSIRITREVATTEEALAPTDAPEVTHANAFARCMTCVRLPDRIELAQKKSRDTLVSTLAGEDGLCLRESITENISRMYVCLSCQKVKTHVFASPGSGERGVRKRTHKVKNTNVTVTSMQDPNKPVSRAFGLANTMVYPFATFRATSREPCAVYSPETGLKCMESSCEKSGDTGLVVSCPVVGHAVSVPGSGVYTMSPCCARLVEMDSLVAQSEDSFMCVPCANTTRARDSMLEQCADYLVHQREASHYNSVKRSGSSKATDPPEGTSQKIACLFCNKKFSAWAPNTYRVCTMTDHRKRQGVVYLCRRKHYFSVFDTKIWEMRKAILYIKSRQR